MGAYVYIRSNKNHIIPRRDVGKYSHRQGEKFSALQVRRILCVGKMHCASKRIKNERRTAEKRINAKSIKPVQQDRE